jgi:hypothetical protein
VGETFIASFGKPKNLGSIMSPKQRAKGQAMSIPTIIQMNKLILSVPMVAIDAVGGDGLEYPLT